MRELLHRPRKEQPLIGKCREDMRDGQEQPQLGKCREEMKGGQQEPDAKPEPVREIGACGVS